MARIKGVPNTPYTQDSDASGNLFNYLQRRYKLKTDAALAEFVEMTNGNVSKIRHGRYEVGPKCILVIHEKTGIPVKTIRDLIAGAEINDGPA